MNGKRKTRNNIGPLLDEHGHLTNRDTDKAEMLSSPQSSVPMMDLRAPVTLG